MDVVSPYPVHVVEGDIEEGLFHRCAGVSGSPRLSNYPPDRLPVATGLTVDPDREQRRLAVDRHELTLARIDVRLRLRHALQLTSGAVVD